MPWPAIVVPEKSLKTHEVPYSSYLGMVGVLAGLAVSQPYADKIKFPLPNGFFHTLLRGLICNAGLAATFLGIRAIEKSGAVQSSGSPALIAFLRFLRYGSVAPYGLVGCASMIKKFGL